MTYIAWFVALFAALRIFHGEPARNEQERNIAFALVLVGTAAASYLLTHYLG